MQRDGGTCIILLAVRSDLACGVVADEYGRSMKQDGRSRAEGSDGDAGDGLHAM